MFNGNKAVLALLVSLALGGCGGESSDGDSQVISDGGSTFDGGSQVISDGGGTFDGGDCKVVTVSGVGEYKINSEEQCVMLIGGGVNEVTDMAKHTSKIFSRAGGVLTIYHRGGVVDLSESSGMVRAIDIVTGNVENKISPPKNPAEAAAEAAEAAAEAAAESAERKAEAAERKAEAAAESVRESDKGDLVNRNQVMLLGIVGHFDSSKGPVLITARPGSVLYDDAAESGDILINSSGDGKAITIYHHGGTVHGNNEQNLKIINLDNGDTDSAMDCFNPEMFSGSGPDHKITVTALDNKIDDYVNGYTYVLRNHNGRGVMGWTIPSSLDNALIERNYKLSPIQNNGTLSYSEMESGFDFMTAGGGLAMLHKEVFDKNIPFYDFALQPNQAVVVKANVAATDYDGKTAHYKTIRKLTFVGHEIITAGGVDYQTCHFHTQTHGSYFGQADKENVVSMKDDRGDFDQWIAVNSGATIQIARSDVSDLVGTVTTANQGVKVNGKPVVM